MLTTFIVKFEFRSVWVKGSELKLSLKSRNLTDLYNFANYVYEKETQMF